MEFESKIKMLCIFRKMWNRTAFNFIIGYFSAFIAAAKPYNEAIDTMSL